MSPQELQKCIRQHEKNQSQIAHELGISSSGMSKWANGSRQIDERDSKLLRLYFYGEIPFGGVRPEQDLSEILKFTPREWGIITTLATRVGMSPDEWIAEQVRTIICFRSAEISPTLKVAEDEAEYNATPNNNEP